MEIPLTQGLVAIVDDTDYASLSQHRWYAERPGGTRGFYAARWTLGVGHALRERVHMHRVIVAAKPGEIVDHVNGDTLNNRRENLRIVTNAQNCMNRARKLGKIGKYKGTARQRRRWQAQIWYDDRAHYLGLFLTEEDAARAYDKTALRVFGPYARTNFSTGAG